MAIINSVNKMLHCIRVKLYPNYLPQVEGGYIARTDNEASLSIEEVCAALKNRGGFTGNYDDLVEHVEQFLDEAAYQLCDGFAVNRGYFSIHPNVGGAFDKATKGHDTQKHPVTFRFRTWTPLRSLAEHIVVEVEGLADVQGSIDEVADISTEGVNETLTPGGMFSIAGHKIKVAGEVPEVGGIVCIRGRPEPVGQGERAFCGKHPFQGRAIGVIPALAAGTWKVEIKTQYSGASNTPLKNLRVIESPFVLSTPAARM